jgi:hypothetical protein
MYVERERQREMSSRCDKRLATAAEVLVLFVCRKNQKRQRQRKAGAAEEPTERAALCTWLNTEKQLEVRITLRSPGTSVWRDQALENDCHKLASASSVSAKNVLCKAAQQNLADANCVRWQRCRVEKPLLGYCAVFFAPHHKRVRLEAC